MPKRRIDFSDIPELSAAQLCRMKRVGRLTIGRAPLQSGVVAGGSGRARAPQSQGCEARRAVISR
jgi:hypothetical protein